MKKYSLFAAVLFGCMLLTSCMSSFDFYQVYTLQPREEANKQNVQVQDDQRLVYEDQNCIVEYNFWEEGGTSTFRMYNKTDSLLYINLRKSFYVQNGKAYDYFQYRTYSKSASSTFSSQQTNTYGFGQASAVVYGNKVYSNGATATNTNTEASVYNYSSSLARSESPFILIPPHSYKTIEGFTVNTMRWVDCDLEKDPATYASIDFDRSNSPLTIMNYLTYTIGQTGAECIVQNDFYMSRITNVEKSAFYQFVQRPEICPNVVDYKMPTLPASMPTLYDRVANYVAKGCFYITYKLESQNSKHKEEKLNYYYWNENYQAWTNINDNINVK